jgi:hypothetical protein
MHWRYDQRDPQPPSKVTLPLCVTWQISGSGHRLQHEADVSKMTLPHQRHLRGEQPMNMFPPSPALHRRLFERFAT